MGIVKSTMVTMDKNNRKWHPRHDSFVRVAIQQSKAKDSRRTIIDPLAMIGRTKKTRAHNNSPQR